MKSIAQDVLFFAITALSLTTFKIVKGVKSFLKPRPKVYVCVRCQEQILRGTEIFVNKEIFCLNCFLMKGGV